MILLKGRTAHAIAILFTGFWPRIQEELSMRAEPCNITIIIGREMSEVNQKIIDTAQFARIIRAGLGWEHSPADKLLPHSRVCGVCRLPQT